jgi:hypothetical protein
MAPDFEYFFKMSTGGEHGHTLLGILYFDVPVTILLAFLFHLIIREPLLANLPVTVQKRLTPLRSFNFLSYLKMHYGVFLVSAVMGSFSHILWDSFTHNGGMVVKQVAFLREYYVPYDGARYPMWYFLQHLFTVIGLVAVLAYCMRIKRVDSPVVKPSLEFWLWVTALMSMIYAARWHWGPSMRIGDSVISFITAAMVALLASSFVWITRRKGISYYSDRD